MRKYDVYHTDGKGNNIMATSRTRKDSAIKIAEKVTLGKGERVVVLQDMGEMPGDYKRVYCREGRE
jgi:hypothetical protein